MTLAIVGTALGYAPQTTNGAGGNILKWPQKEIVVSISDSFTSGQFDGISRNDVEAIVKESFEVWARESGIKLRFRTVKSSSISPSSSGGDGISLITIAPTAENLLQFGEKRTNLSAITRLFYDDDGNIAEADIVLNPTARFSNDGSRGSFDLRATLTHEAGHFLGLGHSRVGGATMHKHQGKNGVFALPATYARTLTEDDRAGIRSLYGPAKEDAHDYGSVSGILQATPISKTHVWLENLENGTVAAGIESDETGKFTFNSVPTGLYRVFAEDNDGLRLFESAKILEIEKDAETESVLKPAERFAGSTPAMFGFNGQISEIAIPVERGNSYTIYIVCKCSEPKDIRIESSSPYISIEPDSLTDLYFIGEKRVLSFEVSISDSASEGEYSLRIFEGERLLGAPLGLLTVDNVVNPWHSSRL